MKFDQLVVLLPCLSLEDFTLERSADEAEQLLGAWSALWHPALIASAQVTPSWQPAENPPPNPAGHLIIVPSPSESLLEEGWIRDAEQNGARIIRGVQRRADMVEAALEGLDTSTIKFDSEVIADFHALGYCHFLVELLTRQLRYMSNLDEESFRRQLLEAVDLAVEGNAKETHERLQAAFDLLHEAREYFYPVEAHMLDLTLVAPTTMGASLRAQLRSPLPTNAMISADVLEQMATHEPETLALLKESLDNGTASLIGGEYDDRPIPLLGRESIRENVERGLASYEKHLGTRPTVFGRRRYGLSPVLPGLLKQLGFTGIVHSTLDDGRFPTGNQSRIQWEGIDSSVGETLARVPTDISRADAFLRLPERLSDSMDLDHVATVVLAHWPGQSSPWYEDLRRIAGYTSAVGTFSTVEKYFEDTYMAGQQARYEADQYRAPYLIQDVRMGSEDPISRWTTYYRRRAALDAVCAMQAVTAMVAGKTRTADVEEAFTLLKRHVEDSIIARGNIENGDSTIDDRLKAQSRSAMQALADTLSGKKGEHNDQGRFLVNPWSFPRRVATDVSDLNPPPNETGPVRAVGPMGGKATAIVDLPAMGFAWIGPGGDEIAPQPEPRRRKRKANTQEEPPLAEEHCLQNDFLRVRLDPHTGAIRSVSDYQTRGARLAQQIALRLPGARSSEGEDNEYSVMVADDVAVTSSGPLLGEIVSRGRLVDREVRRLAGFTQTTRVRRGSPVVDVQIDLDIDQLPGPDPWHSYYAVRFAWGDATANLYRSVNMANVPTDTRQIEAPQFLDIRSGTARTTILTGGLPYHRRFGLRKLDSLLVVHGEKARSFRFGIGIDVPHPVAASLDFLAPEVPLCDVPALPVPSGWLFHLDRRNVTATHWVPLFVEGRLLGFRARLLETDGLKTELGLRSFRPTTTAAKLRPGDSPNDKLTVDGDRISVPLGPHEWVEIEAQFTE